MVITYLANAVWMTCLVAAVTAVAAWAIERSSAAHRNALWAFGLALASLAPLSSLPAGHAAQSTDGPPTAAGGSMTAPGRGDRQALPASVWHAIRSRQRSVSLAPRLAEMVAGAYLLLLAGRVLKLSLACRRARCILRGATPASLSEVQAAVVRRLGSVLAAGRVSIVSSRQVQGPVVLGVRRRVLVLPAWFAAKASEQEFESAIWHELAHVRRHDFLFNLLYELLLLPIGFHPAALFIKAQIDRSRELACDEFAALRLPTRTAYARSLVSIARTIVAKASSGPSGCAVGLFDSRTLEERVMNLMGSEEGPCGTPGSGPAMLASGLLAATCLGASLFSIQVARAGSGQDQERFAGLWEAERNGKTFVTLRLTATAGKISGTVSRMRIELGPRGELTEAVPLGVDDPIVEAIVEGRVMHLTTRARERGLQDDSADSVQYDMSLVGIEAAELLLKGTPSDTATPGPWKLSRRSREASGCTASSGENGASSAARGEGRRFVQARTPPPFDAATGHLVRVGSKGGMRTCCQVA